MIILKIKCEGGTILLSAFFSPGILFAMAATRNVMRAVRVFEFGGPEVLKLQSDALIPSPKENQVCMSPVNFGDDTGW